MGYSKVVKALKASKGADDSIIGILKKTILEADNGFYSARIIKQRTKEFLQVLDRPERSNAEVFFAFFNLYEAFYAAPHREFGYHPSSLADECDRKLFYEMSGEKPQPKKSTITPENQLTFDIGTMLHAYIQFKLYKAGLLRDCEVPIKTEEGIVGKDDGELVFKGEDILLEIKTINDRGYNSLSEPMIKHQKQASLYAKKRGIKRILYLYINKNTSQMKPFLIDRVEKWAKEQEDKCVAVNKAVEEKKAPDRVCMNVISERALKCPFADKCFS